MAAHTSAANTGVTEMHLISQIVQTNLLEETVLLNTAMDHSSKLIDGIKSIDLPRFGLGALGRFGDPEDSNVDNETPVTKKTVTFEADTIVLDQWKNLAYTLGERDMIQSRIPIEAELAVQAGRDFAIYMDKEVAAQYSALTQSVTMTGPADVANPALTSTLSLADITEARKILNKNNVSRSERYLIVSPCQEKAMLNIENFIHADKYGAREALLNGEIGKVFDFRVVVSNLVADEEAFAVQKECVAYAMQQSVNYKFDDDVCTRTRTHSYYAGWGLTTTYGGLKGVKFSL